MYNTIHFKKLLQYGILSWYIHGHYELKVSVKQALFI